ncbi:Fluoroquinolones export ATP-binding protein [Crateriforma conspicua]|uniref:Fluoroquinolones export ATP-binding protein n=1 Tax=Crateriforma conspicua TaxID=2527996 RepID=A0A5C6FL64_9PLAN|nr:Fluoroquinolones export ATP-binding protein [Crateriforma conspicua]
MSGRSWPNRHVHYDGQGESEFSGRRTPVASIAYAGSESILGPRLIAFFFVIFLSESFPVANDAAAVAESQPDSHTDPTSAPAGAPDSGVVIETRNLSKVYRDFWGRRKVNALKSLDIEVRPGEIFGLLGPNGSGKSTTIKLILGLLFPSSGRVLVFDKDASETQKNERIGYLPEESYLYKFLTAEETLDFYGRLFNMSAADRKRRVAELIQMVGLHGAKHRQLREYSKGMTRRVGLAQALINDPDLILLDEPTTGLDPIGTREMKDLILSLRDQGKTVLLCSHQLADVQDVCDRVAILHQGELKELGRVTDLLKVQDVTEVHASGLSDQAKQEIAEVIQRHGGEVKSIDNPTATMEDLFLNIVRESEARPGARRVSAPATGENQAAGEGADAGSRRDDGASADDQAEG